MYSSHDSKHICHGLTSAHLIIMLKAQRAKVRQTFRETGIINLYIKLDFSSVRLATFKK